MGRHEGGLGFKSKPGLGRHAAASKAQFLPLSDPVGTPPMFMTAKEIINNVHPWEPDRNAVWGAPGEGSVIPTARAESDVEVWSRKYDEGVDKGLPKALDTGVRKPVTLAAGFIHGDGKPEISGGHHRVAVEALTHPDRLMPVAITETHNRFDARNEAWHNEGDHHKCHAGSCAVVKQREANIANQRGESIRRRHPEVRWPTEPEPPNRGENSQRYAERVGRGQGVPRVQQGGMVAPDWLRYM